MEKKGKPTQDIWEFKDSVKPIYPTEKNIEMIKKIISTSSNVNDLVLDCFCGSGTTIIAANELNRRWIGVDKSEKSIEIINHRLNNMDSNLFNFNDKFEFIKLEQ